MALDCSGVLNKLAVQRHIESFNLPVTARDYWIVIVVALFWMLVLLTLTEAYNIPLGSL